MKYRYLICIILLCISSNAYAFFPIGIFAPVSASDTIHNMGFNFIVGPTNDTDISIAKNHGLKSMSNIYFTNPDNIELIKNIKDNDNILAWYPIDEPDLYNITPNTVSKWIHQIKEINSDIPVFFNVYNMRKYKQYCDLPDIFGINPYPIVSDKDEKINHLERVFFQTQYAESLCRDKQLFVIIQSFYQKPWWLRSPTAKELHNMVYQALMAGAKGLIYFTYAVGDDWRLEEHKDIMKEIKIINKEIKSIEDILLKGTLISWADVRKNKILFSIYTYKDNYYIFIVNPYMKKGEFRLSQANKYKNIESLFNKSSFNYRIDNDDNSIIFKLEPLEYHIVKISK